jgi:LacI family transcriptional regulator
VAATIKDVARACGVHVSTVSRTFSAPNLVNPETRRRVLAVAEQLEYRPNKAARALITGRTTNLGLIVADIANPYFPPMIKAAQSQARLHDHHIFVADTDEDPAVEEELVRALAPQVDGILLCSPRMATRALEQLSGEVALVVVNRLVADIPAVVMDLASGAKQAVGHLADLGHRTLAYVGGPRVSWTNRELRRAAVAAARLRGADLTVLGPFPPNYAGGVESAQAVRASGATGVLAYNDVVAVGLIDTLRAGGVQVPGDVSVIGVDDVPQAAFARVTTIATPTDAAGRAAIDMLLQAHLPGRGRVPAQLGSDNHQQQAVQLLLPTILVVRESTGPAPKH